MPDPRTACDPKRERTGPYPGLPPTVLALLSLAAAWRFRFDPVELAIAALPAAAFACYLASPAGRGRLTGPILKTWVLPRLALAIAGAWIAEAVMAIRQPWAKPGLIESIEWTGLVVSVMSIVFAAGAATKAIGNRRGPALKAAIGLAVALALAPGALAIFQGMKVKLLPRLAPDALGLGYGPVSTEADGLRLHAWYVPGDAGHPAVIACHGIGANRSDVVKYAAALHGTAKGLNRPMDARRHVLFVDLRGHGESDGHLITFGRREARDVSAWLEWLVANTHCDASRISAFGASMGAATVLQAAGREPRLAAVIADASFIALPDVIGDRVQAAGPLAPAMGWVLSAWGSALLREPASRVSPYASLTAARATPILFIHGVLDREIPLEHSLRLYRRKVELEAPHVSSVLYVYEGRHTRGIETAPEEYARQVNDFLDRVVGR